MDVAEYWEIVFHKSIPAPHAEHYTEYTMDTHCGQVCKVIIDQAALLLAICDTHPHVVDNILKGTEAACSVVCFG